MHEVLESGDDSILPTLQPSRSRLQIIVSNNNYCGARKDHNSELFRILNYSELWSFLEEQHVAYASMPSTLFN